MKKNYKNVILRPFFCANLRIFMVAVFIMLINTTLHASMQDEKVQINIKNGSFASLVEQISKQTKYTILFKNEDIKGLTNLNINKNATVKQVLTEVLANTNLHFTYEGNSIVISRKNAPQMVKGGETSKKVTITGKVLSSDTREPIVGATVLVIGTTSGAITDQKGQFSISAPENSKVEISYSGMLPEVKNITGATSNLVIELKADVVALDDVVVTGYQTISKERSTGSYSVISEKNLKSKIETNIVNKLEGMVPGLTSVNGNIEIRGKSTLNANSQPLYVVDGFPFEGNLSSINPNEISNITVLKDAAAASIYGARSANGVIVITTRSGDASRTTVEYSGNVSLKGLRDQRDYLNLMNSSELVDWQKNMFDIYHNPTTQINKRYYLNDVSALLYENADGKITDQELEEGLNVYRNRNNRNEYDKMDFMRNVSAIQQHNVSIRGGSEKYRYSASVNYEQKDDYNKNNDNNRVGYTLKGNYNFFKWLKADVGVIGSHTKMDESYGFVPTYMKTGVGTYPSYQMVYDETGNEMKWMMSKSQSEMDRLMGIGLNDESYYPMQEHDRMKRFGKSGYTNINVGINATILKGLTLDVKYQLEKTNGLAQSYKDGDSYDMRSMVNNSSKHKDGKITYGVPTGGMLEDLRDDKSSYTFRTQLNFNRTFGEKHEITSLLGAERRNVNATSTQVVKYGYNPVSLSHKLINEEILGIQLTGTESIPGTFNMWPSDYPATFGDIVNRYVSFYANGGYTYDGRYAISASVRMDQSNLFGTDPEFQYRPLWSVGLKWHVTNEKFMENVKWVNMLVVRGTKGINGNVSQQGGPFLIAKDNGLNTFINEYSTMITSPPNSGLRWERTNQTNIGVDFSLFKGRLNGSVEYYSKNTTDLLGERSSDPTIGWSKLMMNYGAMTNKGYEISLNSVNIRTKNFQWTTGISVAYNKNRVTKLDAAAKDATSYIKDGNIREGMAVGTLYSVKWAGLDKDGRPQAYKKDGSIVSSFKDITLDDLVETGCVIPPYASALTNNLTYKNINLSFMFLMYSGNKMRANTASIVTNPQGYNSGSMYANLNRDMANYWKSADDTNKENVVPAVYRNASTNSTYLWDAADKHVENAGYIKLKEIILSYSLPTRVAKKLCLQDLTINAQVQNLAVWGFNDKGLNPETWSGKTLKTEMGSINTPIYSLGLSIKF